MAPLLDHAFVYNEILGLENGDDFDGKLCTDIHDDSNQNETFLDAKKVNVNLKNRNFSYQNIVRFPKSGKVAVTTPILSTFVCLLQLSGREKKMKYSKKCLIKVMALK